MIKIIDNIINPISQDRLETVVNDRDFKWFYKKSLTYRSVDNEDKKLLNKDTAGFTNLIYENGEFTDPVYPSWCWSILDNMTDRTGVIVNELIRVQFNLFYQYPGDPAGESWNAAHTDQQYDHNVLLYYVNDSDGDTFIFNEKRNDNFDELTVMERVSPKKGAAILFDGNNFHASSNPFASTKRITLNFNFI
jgi:hypothetical protein